ncbi:MAG: hypothetical protein ABI433_07235 [Burkholderiaceae bacterium]
MRAADVIDIGSRVVLRTSEGEQFAGYMSERITYSDGSSGAYVELDDGPVIVVPVAELRAE